MDIDRLKWFGKYNYLFNGETLMERWCYFNTGEQLSN